jgi:MFS transporter, MHS family, proline/betaine transporter
MLQEGADMSSNPAEPREAPPPVLRRAILASALGNATEWYDYGVYSYLAPIIGVVIFNSHDPASGLLYSFLALAISFVIRPVGGIVLGPLGDRIGRQRVLVATILIMSLATFALGLLPAYAAIGIWSPVLLVLIRLVQGFSTGGEYGGAATFMAEYAPPRRRGFWCSWLEFGTLGGYSVGAGLVTLLTFLLPHQAMLSWGWRVPFLLALPLGITGLYLRYRLDEPPCFKELEANGELSRSRLPVLDAIRHAWRPILLCIGIVILLNVSDYTILSYLPSYFSQVLRINDTVSLLVVVATQIAMMAIITQVGALSDRIGRKPILIAVAVGFIVLSYPAFWVIGHGGLAGVVIGMLALGLLLVLFLGTEPATLPALFPAPYRYGGFAIGYNISTALFGGTAPSVITLLISLSHNTLVPAYYLMGAAVISLVPILLMPETARVSIRGTGVPGRQQSPEPAVAG